MLARESLVPNQQFGFREDHSTIEQVHIVYNIIKNALKRKEYCTAVYVDITQAFDNFGTNTRNRVRPRTYSKLWSALTRTDRWSYDY